jgi:hypothetical protein
VKRTILAAAAAFLATGALAAPLVDSGTGAGTTQAEAAYSTWQTRVSSFSVDNLAGLTGSTTSRTSSAGNNFVAGGTTTLGIGTSGSETIQGTHLQVFRNGQAQANFTWTTTAAAWASRWSTAPR